MDIIEVIKWFKLILRKFQTPRCHFHLSKILSELAQIEIKENSAVKNPI